MCKVGIRRNNILITGSTGDLSQEPFFSSLRTHSGDEQRKSHCSLAIGLADTNYIISNYLLSAGTSTYYYIIIIIR